jgi:DNA repair photolyase
MPRLSYLEDTCKSALNRVPEESRLPFRWTVNPYRGCSHSCHYCFARAYHAYLDLGIGEDFASKIVVKTNVVEVLRAELASPRWTGEPIAMGTATDPYQHCEGRYRLTRGILTALADFENPLSILTKSTLIVRDLDELRRLDAVAGASVSMSVGTLDEQVRRVIEPGTPPGRRRLEVLARFADAGIRTGVLVAPILPGISDDEEHLDRAPCQAVDSRALHALAARGLPVALPTLRGAVREARLRAQVLPRRDLRTIRPAAAAARARGVARAPGPGFARAARPAGAGRLTYARRARFELLLKETCESTDKTCTRAPRII